MSTHAAHSEAACGERLELALVTTNPKMAFARGTDTRPKSVKNRACAIGSIFWLCQPKDIAWGTCIMMFISAKMRGQSSGATKKATSKETVAIGPTNLTSLALVWDSRTTRTTGAWRTTVQNHVLRTLSIVSF